MTYGGRKQNLYFCVHIAGRTVLRSVFICPKTIIEPVPEHVTKENVTKDSEAKPCVL